MPVLPITDAAYAERMLRAALGGEPQLSEEQIADLMVNATSIATVDGLIVSQFTERDLNRSASVGWQWKAAITANQYDLGGGAGKTLDRSEWHKHCIQQSVWFADGTYSVLGGSNVAGGSSRKGGIGVIGLTSSFAREGDY